MVALGQVAEENSRFARQRVGMPEQTGSIQCPDQVVETPDFVGNSRGLRKGKSRTSPNPDFCMGWTWRRGRLCCGTG